MIVYLSVSLAPFDCLLFDFWLATEKQGDTQPAITCSKLLIETLEQGVKYIQN